MKRRRILHVVWSCDGGVERLVASLIAEQRRDTEIQPELLIARDRQRAGTMARETGVTVTVGGFRHGWDPVPVLRGRLDRMFRSADVIHLHAYNPWIAWLAIRSRRPVVFTEHGTFGFGRRTRAGDRIRSRLQRHFLNRSASYVTFNSNFSQVTAEARYGLDDVRRQVVYNGIPMDTKPECDPAVDRMRTSLDGAFVVGTVARLAGMKRIDRLVRGFGMMTADSPCALVIVGDGPLRSELERQVAAAQLTDRVHFVGFRERALAWYGLFDVMVVPSRFEPFGLVAAEAMAAGCPTVVFRDGGGLIEVVGSVEPRDVVADEAELADRLVHYRDGVAHPGDAERRRARARAFTIESTKRAFDRIYDQVCEAS